MNCQGLAAKSLYNYRIPFVRTRVYSRVVMDTLDLEGHWQRSCYTGVGANAYTHVYI